LPTILSTKKLTQSQKGHILNAGLAIVDIDFIETEELAFEFSSKVENAIFTSQNGVRAVLSKNIEIENAYCVGKRVGRLIEEKGIRIQFVGRDAEELGQFIVEKESKKKYTYFCAKDRLDTLPSLLTVNNIKWNEIPVYKTRHIPKKYEQQFNGVLFFSPSGVESYFNVNSAPEHSFCIGNTTAKTLKKYTNNYTVASQTTVENVLIKAIKHFKK